MYVTQPQKDQAYAPDGVEALGQPWDAPEKWSQRKALAFVTVASSFLWALIIYAAIQIL
jgi:hypothetical protein